MAIYFIPLTAICAIVLIKLAQILYKRSQFVAIIDKIPGPKGYPILGNALAELNVSREDRYEWIQVLCNEYKGGIFRTWRGMQANVDLTTAETISVIMPHKSLITKSKVYHFLSPWLGTGLLISTGDKWHGRRKLITPSFHFNILEEFAVVMSEKAEILKKCIVSAIKNNPDDPIDMFDLLTKCALDIICGLMSNLVSESAMGINVNAQTDPDAEYCMALQSISTQATERILRPWLHADWIFFHTSRGKRFKRTVETAHKFTYQVINKKKLARQTRQRDPEGDICTDKPERKAFLDHLLDACDGDDMPLTDDELREEVDTFMFEGHDTTAAAMSWAVFCIGNNPDVEEKIHQEQLQVFGDSTEPATFQQLSELKYLERVIKETLRLFPSVPSVARHLTEDVEIAGYKIPKNTTVGLRIFQVHRDPKYRPEPEKFDPDRFLPENTHGRHPYAYIPFSAGPRNCIGQKFALLEEKIVLTALLRTWRVRSLLKYDEAKCYMEFVLRPQHEIKIYFTHK